MEFVQDFQRIEVKYLLTKGQLSRLMPVFNKYMVPDRYPCGTNCSLYLDTPDHLLIRRSLEKPRYKEKLRLRSYGTPGVSGATFLEIKKKSGGIIYKRRICLPADTAMAYLEDGILPPEDSQILREIDFMINRYGLEPSLMVCYDRHSYAEAIPSRDSLRITMDERIRWRDTQLDLRRGDRGQLLLAPDELIMEVKTAAALPLWLLRALYSLGIRQVSFSKVGHAYLQQRSASSQIFSAAV